MLTLPRDGQTFSFITLLLTRYAMNQSTVQSIGDPDVFLVFKGAFFFVAPLTIPLSLIVVVENAVIFVNYYNDRNRLIPSLFMGIALSDILRAQGEFVLSVISILAYTGLVEVTVLYKSLVYYMFTALPGVNWSKVFNIVMTISITIKVSNPFYRINFQRLQKIVACICFAITMLHVSDAIILIVILVSPIYPGAYLYIDVFAGFIIPGGITAAAIYCPGQSEDSGTKRCDLDHYNTGNHDGLLAGLIYLTVATYFLAPPLIMLTCMIIQVINLRRSLQEREGDEVTPLMPNTARHVSITVFSVSLLFFICNAAYILCFMGIWPDVVYSHGSMNYSDKGITELGMLLGVTEFTLPLIYAVLYPIILISRKEELRRKCVGYWRRLTAWTRSDRNEEAGSLNE